MRLTSEQYVLLINTHSICIDSKLEASMTRQLSGSEFFPPEIFMITEKKGGGNDVGKGIESQYK